MFSVISFRTLSSPSSSDFFRPSPGGGSQTSTWDLDSVCTASRCLDMGHETWCWEIRELLRSEVLWQDQCHQGLVVTCIYCSKVTVPRCSSSTAWNLCRVSKSSSSRGMGQGSATTNKNFRQSTNSEFVTNKDVNSCNQKKTGNAIGMFV